MAADIPKQYLPLAGATVIEHSLRCLLDDPRIDAVILALHPDDTWFKELALSNHPKVSTVVGGLQRADSVLAALDTLDDSDWVLVHDAARPCLHPDDLGRIIHMALHGEGGILASPVCDTIKRAGSDGSINETVCRENLWRAQTPQSFSCGALRNNLRNALAAGVAVTDEASAMEWAGDAPKIIEGRSDNIKITRSEDLALAEFFISHRQES